tara:strand:- start:1189 stop:2211 length:1023 start_codon:yes stop_codon:yes gene_type:complete
MNNFNSVLNELIQEKIYENLPGKKTRRGSRINVRCWICGDSRLKQSKRRGWFYTNNDPISYHCFNKGCTASGINLLAKLVSTSSKEASKLVFKKIKQYNDNDTSYEDLTPSGVVSPIQEEEEVVHEELEIPNYWVDLNEDAKQILTNRKILEAPFKPRNWKLYYSTRHKRIAIPWVSQGKIDTYQYRAMYKNQEPKYTFKYESAKSIFETGKFDDMLDYYFYLEGTFDAIFIQNGLAIGGIFPNAEQQTELSNRYSLMDGVWIPDNPWVDESAKEEIFKRAKTNPKDLIFYWDKDWSSKDINEHIIKSKNINLFDYDFLESRITTVFKFATALKFGRAIQ